MKILVTTCQNQINVLRCRNICFGSFLSFVIMPKVSSKNQLRWLEFFMCSMIIQERVILKNTVVSWCDPCFINMSRSHCQIYVRSCLSVKYHHKSSSWKLILLVSFAVMLLVVRLLKSCLGELWLISWFWPAGKVVLKLGHSV